MIRTASKLMICAPQLAYKGAAVKIIYAVIAKNAGAGHCKARARIDQGILPHILHAGVDNFVKGWYTFYRRELIMGKKHEKTKKILKIIGPIIALCGLGLAIMGFADMIISTRKGEMPSLFWGLIAGLPLIAIGAMISLTGFRREIIRYTKNESVPVVNEAGEEIAPAVSAIASAAKGAERNICPDCGKPNEEGAKFCRHCGKPLYITCPVCGEQVRAGAYCDKCGAKLD